MYNCTCSSFTLDFFVATDNQGPSLASLEANGNRMVKPQETDKISAILLFFLLECYLETFQSVVSLRCIFMNHIPLGTSWMEIWSRMVANFIDLTIPGRPGTNENDPLCEQSRNDLDECRIQRERERGRENKARSLFARLD